MRSNVESHLKHLDAPEAPDDLRARCLVTVPQRTKPAHAPARRTPMWRAQRFALAGGLLLVTAIGSAFWSTRPSNQEGQTSSSSMAFAQTLKAMANIEVFHMRRKDRNAVRNTGEWYQLETWVDTKRGAYAIITNSPYATTNFPSRYAKMIRTLLLPDDTSYERANSHLVVFKRPHVWRDLKEQISPMLLGNVASTSKGAWQTRNFYTGGAMKLKSTQIASWQGKQAQLFVMRASTSRDNPYAPPTMRKIYVDRSTNLVIASQDFALVKDAKPLLMSQVEFDYARPNASFFDPQRLKEGATQIIHKP